MADPIRIARNEAMFRGLNENIAAGRDRADDHATVGFVCECGFADCHRIIEMTVRQYEAVRADARRSFVLPGHELPEAEDVVERHPGWLVVQKRGEAAELVTRSDPRSG